MKRNERRGRRTESRTRHEERGTRHTEASSIFNVAPGLCPQSLEIHIEALVLHGLAPGDRYHIADAVERELTRLFAAHGLPPSLARNSVIERLDGGAFTVTPGAQAETIGAHVARAAYGGIGKPLHGEDP